MSELIGSKKQKLCPFGRQLIIDQSSIVPVGANQGMAQGQWVHCPCIKEQCMFWRPISDDVPPVYDCSLAQWLVEEPEKEKK